MHLTVFSCDFNNVVFFHSSTWSLLLTKREREREEVNPLYSLGFNIWAFGYNARSYMEMRDSFICQNVLSLFLFFSMESVMYHLACVLNEH